MSYKVSNVTILEEEHSTEEHKLYGTKIGQDDEEMALAGIIMGKTEEESKKLAELIVNFLNDWK